MMGYLILVWISFGVITFSFEVFASLRKIEKYWLMNPAEVLFLLFMFVVLVAGGPISTFLYIRNYKED